MQQKGVIPVAILIIAAIVVAGAAGAYLGFQKIQNDRTTEQNPANVESSPSPFETTTPTPIAKKTTTPTKKPTPKPISTPLGTPVYGTFGTTPAPAGPDCSMYNLSGQTSDIKVTVCPTTGSLSYSPYAYVQAQNGCKILDGNYTDKLSRYVTTTYNNCKEVTFGSIPPGPYSVWSTLPTGSTVGSQSVNVALGTVSQANFTAPASY